MGEARYLTAREAAEELGVSLATLYAYVSRGRIRSESAGGRSRRYRAEDVRRLKARKEWRRDPGAVVEGALSWGTPVMESAITLVTDDGLYYRGRDAVVLSAGSTVEEVAALIWTGDPARAAELFPAVLEHPPDVPGGLRPVEAFQVLLPMAGAADPAAYDLRPEAVARTGARILRLMASAVAGEGIGSRGDARARLVSAEPRGGRAARGGLILCADHELPVSTFAARCVASSEATPYAVTAAGLAALGYQARRPDRVSRGLSRGGRGRRRGAGGDLRPPEAWRGDPRFRPFPLPGWRPTRRRAAARHGRGVLGLTSRRALGGGRRRGPRAHRRAANRGLRARDARAHAGAARGRGGHAVRAGENHWLDRARHRTVRKRLAHTPQGSLHRKLVSTLPAAACRHFSRGATRWRFLALVKVSARKPSRKRDRLSRTEKAELLKARPKAERAESEARKGERADKPTEGRRADKLPGEAGQRATKSVPRRRRDRRG